MKNFILFLALLACNKPPAEHSILDWGAIPNDGLDDRIAIQRALDYADSLSGENTVLIPIGVFDVIANPYREGLYVGDSTTFKGKGFGSIIRYTGHPTLSSSAIQNRRSSGMYSDIQQRVGNKDIHYRDFKLVFTEMIDFKNIGVSMGGVDRGSIKNVWVDSCGGYSFLIARTNDTDTVGNESKNIVIDSIRITNFLDQGLEIWGATNVKATNIEINGEGTNNGFGNGILVWNGAQDIYISKVTVFKLPSNNKRHVCAIALGGWPVGVNPEGKRRTSNIVIENINAVTDMAIRILNQPDSLDIVSNVRINNGIFLSYDGVRPSTDIRYVENFNCDCVFNGFK